MKRVEYKPGLQRNPHLLKRVSQTESLLNIGLGEFAEETTAEWDLARFQYGKLLLVLRLRDSVTEATGVLEPKAFEDPNELSYQLDRTARDLLSNRAQFFLDRAMIPAEVEE